MKLRMFLRYNSRHQLWFPGDWQWPQLDPISSSSHSKSGKRTFSLYEPRWFHLLRQRMCVVGRHRCGRRMESWVGSSPHFGGDKPLPDTWDLGPDGHRTCSYCGSIHPDDLMEICRKTLVDERYGVEGTDKSYKVYVRQPGVRNAAEGAIKFYMAHAPAEPSKEDKDLFASAVALSRQRFNAKWALFRSVK